LDLEGGLHLLEGLSLGDAEHGQQGGNQAARDGTSDHQQREVDGFTMQEESRAGGADHQSGTGGFSKGTEQVTAHTGNVSNIVTHIVSNGGRVLGRVFLELFFNLAHQISTHISGLGVDTSTDSAEQSHSGST